MDLKSEIKKLPKSKISLSVTAPEELLMNFFEKAYQDLAKEVEMKGFRKGYGPRSLIMEKIGITRLTEETLNIALTETYHHLLHKYKIQAITGPSIKVKKYYSKEAGGQSNELEYEAEVEVWPEVKVGDYKNLKLKEKNAKLNEAKIKNEIGKILDALKQQHKDKYLEKTNFKTEEELTKAVEGMVRGQEEIKERNQRIDNLIEEILKITEIDLPEALINKEAEALEENLRRQLEAMKMKMDDFLAEQKTTLEELRKNWRTVAERSVRTQLALIEIAKQEKMDLKDQQVMKKVLDKLLEINS